MWSLVAQEKVWKGGAGLEMGGLEESASLAFEPGCYGFELWFSAIEHGCSGENGVRGNTALQAFTVIEIMGDWVNWYKAKMNLQGWKVQESVQKK